MNSTITVSDTVKETAELRVKAARIVAGQENPYLEIAVLALKPFPNVLDPDADLLVAQPNFDLTYNPVKVTETKVEDLAMLMLAELCKVLPTRSAGTYLYAGTPRNRNIYLPLDTEKILTDPTTWNVPLRADEAYLTAKSMNDTVIANLTEERWQAMGDVIAVLAATHPDAAVVVGRQWMAARPGKKVNPNADALKALIPILKEAKIIYTN